ncbi:pyridoxamine 5'-phosphate oxidase family protein [Vineibacter terrae]|uniref:Pyridoxamine 5'-phosphate oxidase family protein n=1 Tax=Vineibacter terrae TaxID=2586908 RepID=A0A5C8PNW0_9HYPH|nr:MSMEG_1061 family FMN-dependent PPOX-type flavoprotein [Vineibacter terrae]TXL76005.1 pyridoxamine 5'-phosphate oxidase family protein [Vineibacter terrae]
MPDSLTPAAAGPAVLDADAARALVASYAKPSPMAVAKDIGRIDRHLRRYIEMSPFCCVATADADGRQDVTPRGDPPGSFKVFGEHTVAIPDRPGNNRLDTLKNLLVNSQIGLVFLLPGMDETARVNGIGRLSVDAALLESMAVEGRAPKCAIVVEVREAYLHCAKAFRRSKLWDPATQIDRRSLPSLAGMIRDQVGLSEEAARQAEDRIEKAYRETLWAPTN